MRASSSDNGFRLKNDFIIEGLRVEHVGSKPNLFQIKEMLKILLHKTIFLKVKNEFSIYIIIC